MASFTGKVVGGSLNLRASCSTGSSALASIPNNTTLTVNTVSGQNDWFQTSFNGTSGYVVAQYIAVTSGTGTCTVTTASDPLNIRKTPSTSATVIYTAAKGATLSLLDNSSVAGWFRVSSASGTGWGSSDYLTADGGSGGDYNYPIQAIVDTDKHGVGGTLNMRAYASSTAEVLTTIPDEATIYVQTLSGEWLPAKYNGITGFVMAKFVRGSDEYGGSGGSTTTSYTFTADDAVTYALNHSDNSGSHVACSMRNTIFTGIDGEDDCADFVHQCLCAGGVPMFNGWFFRLSGIPSSWSNSKWNLTYSGLQKLTGKGWVDRKSVV